MRKVNIIHLSDIHFNNSEDSNNLLEALKNDLLAMKNELEEYHVLIITGDCVDKGKVHLFPDFKKKIDKIIKACGLTKKKVIVTIGNHDSNLENPWLLAMHSEIKSGKSTAETALNNIEDKISTLYQEYNKFDSEYIVTQDGIGVTEIPIKNAQGNPIFRLRIISLNSSWSTTIVNEYGQLTIGDFQLNQIKKQLKEKGTGGKKCDYTFLCMHHPLDWFKYSEREKIEKFINEVNVDFILHGHIHTSDVENISSVDVLKHIFCTGISYLKTGEKSTKKSGMRYSIYQINKDTKTMNVFIRSTNEKGEFVDDNTLYSNVKDGFFTVPLESPFKCLMPFKSIDSEKSSTVLSRDRVEKILKKEDLLFQFYCRMEKRIEEYIKADKESYNSYKSKWIEDKKIDGKLPAKLNEKCKIDFRKENFGLFCYDILINLNALFFDGDENVRFLLRKYVKQSNSHVAFSADGAYSKNVESIKSFEWKTGLIYHSFKKQAALLKSCNPKHYVNGNTNVWKNSLTVAVDGITTLEGNESIPLLSLNIAIDSIKNESCLEALALSSIYDKIGAVFKLYNDKVYRIDKIILAEDKT